MNYSPRKAKFPFYLIKETEERFSRTGVERCFEGINETLKSGLIHLKKKWNKTITTVSSLIQRLDPDNIHRQVGGEECHLGKHQHFLHLYHSLSVYTVSFNYIQSFTKFYCLRM